MRILITGAGGFVGRSLVEAALASGHDVVATLLSGSLAARPGVSVTRVDLSEDAGAVFQDRRQIDAVIHLAGRAHVLKESSADPKREYIVQNVHTTIELAKAAHLAGVRRFVFLSSIGVNGRVTRGRPFSEQSIPAPCSHYAESKWMAECALREFAARTGVGVTIVRVPLVIGPMVKGNLERLLRIVWRGVPLPLASVDNARSFIGVANLSDLLLECASNPAAEGELFLAADDGELSTPEFVRLVGKALGRPARMFPVPAAALKGLANLSGRKQVFTQLCESLVVDGGHVKNILSWRPRVPTSQEVKGMADAWRSVNR